MMAVADIGMEPKLLFNTFYKPIFYSILKRFKLSYFCLK
jgi:hypothetical protein